MSTNLLGHGGRGERGGFRTSEEGVVGDGWVTMGDDDV